MKTLSKNKAENDSLKADKDVELCLSDDMDNY